MFTKIENLWFGVGIKNIQVDKKRLGKEVFLGFYVEPFGF